MRDRKDETIPREALEKDPHFNELQRGIIRHIIVAAYEKGEISVADLDDPQFILEKILKPVSQTNVHLDWIIDYRDTILKDARKFKIAGKHHNAIVFYALYFEHEINGLIRRVMERKGYGDKTIDAPMRLPLQDKLGWLADILEMKRPNQEFIKFLIPFSENRNGYLHYKWKGVDIDKDDSEERLGKLLAEVEKYVRYLKNYVSTTIYAGEKGAVLNRIDNFLDHKTD